MADIKEESLMQQAQHVWAMLDDMSQNNPEAYQKFIDKHMKEGVESMKPPEPHMCVQTCIYESDRRNPFFINIGELSRLPPPKSDEDPIPVMGGNIYCGQDEQGVHKIITVVFNPEVIKDFGRHSPLVEERKLLINLAMNYIEDQQKVKLSRNYTVLDEDTKFKGSLEQLRTCVSKRSGQDSQKFEQELGELENEFGPMASGCKDSLLNKLANIVVEDSNLSQSNINSRQKSEASNIGGPHNIKLTKDPDRPVKTGLNGSSHSHDSKPGQSRLIEELSSSEVILPQPDYKMTIKNSECDKPRRIVIRINLPEVKSVADCQLDISEDDVELMVEDRYGLSVKLTEKVKDSQASAKFNKKSSVLTVTLPTVDQ